MMTFMLDPRCKGLKCVVNLIGKDITWVLMEEYNKKKLIILLVVVFKSFSLGHPQTLPLDALVPNDSLFNEPTSMEKTSEGLLKFELSLFRWNVVSKDLKSPLAW